MARTYEIDKFTHIAGGVIVDHLRRILDAGGSTRTLASGRLVAVASDGSTAPVVCAEVVPVWTEDGPSDGRCGGPVFGAEGFACEGHTEERRGWAAMSEAERYRWEAEADRF